MDGLKYFTTISIPDLDVGQKRKFLIAVPNQKYVPHLIFKISIKSGINFKLFEGPTFSGTGNEIQVFSHDRNCLADPLTQIYDEPTITDDGLLLFNKQYYLEDENFDVFIGNNGNDIQLILKRNTNYYLELESYVVDNRIQLLINFCEELL